MSIQSAYNEWSQTYDTDENRTRDLDQRIMLETLAGQQFHSILEIGCGTGKRLERVSMLSIFLRG
jgi:predicted TPR repeat methyltransferase